MIKIKDIFISIGTLLFFCSSYYVKAQEHLTPLKYNSVITQHKPNQNKINTDISIPIALPFIEDFSSNNVYPNLSHWVDSSAFINNTFAINPPTIGVATLDAIDKYGAHYSYASSDAFVADKLTSRFIRLDSTLTGIPSKITLADSLYFSFYFQPQGLSNNPDPEDSLVLEFLSFPPDTLYIDEDTILQIPADTIISDKWTRIWSHKGISYQNFKTEYGCDFLNVMIPITDVYLRKNFKFRFKNYASIANNQQGSWAANCDQWNIDYIYLNKGRTINDTLYDDVAITIPQTSILSSYQSMPWNHFLVNPSNEMKTSLTIPYANLGNDTKNVKREFFLNDLIGTGSPYYYTGGNLNLLPLETINFSPALSYSFASSTTDNALFEVITTVNTTPDFNRKNDTTRFFQSFENYYAYDDGTPESGYGISSSNFAKLAYKFNARKADTLRGVNIFFNQVNNESNVKFFYLTIWSSLSPEQIIYQEAGYIPAYTDSLNQYRFYRLKDSTVVVNGNFYVGMMQTTTDNMNIGFDKNTEVGWNNSTMSNDLIKYNINGTWQNSLYKGALMIRPVVGNRVPYGVGIEKAQKFEKISIYPNPANDVLFINSDNNNIEIDLLDLTGKIVLSSKNTSRINISSINPGYYIVSVKENSCIIQTEKLIIIR